MILGVDWSTHQPRRVDPSIDEERIVRDALTGWSCPWACHFESAMFRDDRIVAWLVNFGSGGFAVVQLHA